MRKLLVIVFAFLSQGCFSDAGVPIEGIEHNYLVPNKYLSNLKSFASSDQYKGDNAKSMSLLLSDQNTNIFSSMSGREASVLVFLDKKYNSREGLMLDSQGILQEAKQEKCSDWVACYRRNYAGVITDYYFTFDPKNGPLKNKDVIVTVYEGSNIPVAKAEVKGKNSCIFNDVIDGILLQVSTVGDVCSRKNIEILREGIFGLFDSWKISPDAEVSQN